MALTQYVKERIANFIEEKEWSGVAAALDGQHPADVANIITSAPSDAREKIFHALEQEMQADVLTELEGSAEDDVLKGLTDSELSDLVEDMAPDDAADVIMELSEDRSEQVLDLMETEESDEVRELLKYDEESAGGLMTTDVFALTSTMTVEQALDAIRSSELDEPIYYVYVTDNSGRLEGSIGVWELLHVKNAGQTVGSIAKRDIPYVLDHIDQEDVAKAISRYDLTAIPVVNSLHKLVGRITVDDAIDVIEDEASEDIFKLAGSDDAELEEDSALLAFRTRLPWLLITMFITLFSSLILKKFLDFKEVLALSLFVPIVMAMCGSTGMQSSTLIIRSLALRSLEGISVKRLLTKEILAGAMMGAVCGVLLAAWARFIIHIHPEHSIYPAIFLGITAGIALLCSMTFAAVFGAAVPMLLNRVKVDPAVASGPFVTASNDVLALLIYYGITVVLVAFYKGFIL